jgi:hypothetical protein
LEMSDSHSSSAPSGDLRTFSMCKGNMWPNT